MPISYNIYRNDGQGGIVNYATPIATTTSLSFPCGALPNSSDTTFAVRAFDATSGIEEANTEARVRIVLDPQGRNVSRRPERVKGLSARVVNGGSCRVAWGAFPSCDSVTPVNFEVSLTPGQTPDLSRVAATVPYQSRLVGYECTLHGLAENTPYVIAVRAMGTDPDPAGEPESIGVVLAVSPLREVESLVGSAML